jgi:excisionase family DNA binding protein
MPGPTWTVQDAAAAYNVSAATIYRLIKAGRITAYRLGRRTIRLDPAELQAALKG